MAKRNGVPKITKAWLEWARQHDACEAFLSRYRPGQLVTRIAESPVSYAWIRRMLAADGIHYPDCCAKLDYPRYDAFRREATKQLIRIAREVEIVDV